MNKLVEMKDKLIAFLSVAIMGVLLVPAYRLAIYATPYYDDYNYAIYVKEMWNMDGSLLSVLTGVKNAVVTTWNYWQGTYSSVALMSLMPATWGDRFYFLGIWLIITILAVGAFCLGYSLFRYVYGQTPSKSITFASLLTLVLTQTIYEPQQSIYWYNGAIHYTFMHGLLMLLVSLEIKFLFRNKRSDKTWGVVWTAVLSGVIAGANFITALQGFLILIGLIGIAVISKNRNFKLLILPAVVYLTGMAVNVLAPGNSVRKSYYEGVACGPVEAIIKSFGASVTEFGRLTHLMMIVMVLLFVPLFLKVYPNVKFRFGLPGLVTLLSWCFYATGFTPSFYGMGYAGLDRMFAVIKIDLAVLIIINVFYWIGWLYNLLSARGKAFPRMKLNILYYGMCVIFVFLCVHFSNSKVEEFLSYGSYYYVHTGEAYNYRNEYNARVEYIQSHDGIIELQPLIWRPWFLCKKNDLCSNPEAEQNKAMSRWFGREGIFVAGEE